MRTLITVAAALAMLVGSQAYGQYTIAYTVELGGDNHADAFHGGAYPEYTRAADGGLDGKVYNVGDILYWAVVVQVTGVGPEGYDAGGVANLVFDLELRKDGELVAIGHTTAPATVAGFFSNINTGVDDENHTNPLKAAAFPSVFDINSVGGDGGRLIDPVNSGGPNLDFYTFPSTFGFPDGSTAAQGKLVGMGAGYEEVTFGGETSSGTDADRLGVGLATGANSGYCVALGVKALFEGQIATAGLGAGTYVLSLKAGTGNNVVPSDTEQFPICNPGISGGKFAVAAAVTEDSISFNLEGGCTVVAPVMTAAKSVKTHGAAGDFALDLFPGKKTECRLGGPTSVVVTFDRDIRLLGTAADVTVTNGTVSAVSVSGAELTVTMSGATVLSSLTMGFPGVADAQTCGVAVSASTLCIGSAYGDFNGDSAINASDLILTRNNLNKIPTAANFMGDVDVDGAINASDLIKVRNTLNKAIPVDSRCQ